MSNITEKFCKFHRSKTTVLESLCNKETPKQMFLFEIGEIF